MDGKREGHGRIGRAFCSAHFREVPVLLRESGHAPAPDAPPAGARPGRGEAGDPSAPRRRRFIDAFRAEAERSFHPRERRPVDDQGRSGAVHPLPQSTEPAPLPPNADMVAEGVEAVTCLDYGVRCTGWLCPLFALPTVPPEDLLAEAMAAERRRWRRHDPGAARSRRRPGPSARSDALAPRSGGARPRADDARSSDPTDPTSPDPPPSHTF